MKHVLKTSKDCDKEDCPGCNICEGGLVLCKVCGGAEGSLPTDCPGVKMTTEQDEAVYVGILNYAKGYWWEKLRSGWALRWTTHVPTSPGWYWWRESLAFVALLVRVTECGFHYRAGDDKRHDSASFGGQWYGPLQEPGGDAVEGYGE